MLGRLNHIGVAVPSLDEAVATYRRLLGASEVSGVIELPEQGVRVRFVEAPNGQVELLEPMGENSPVAGFLARNPKGGQHHLCFEVADIHAAKAEMEAEGATVLNEPRIGAHRTLVIFAPPKDFHGVLLELMEPVQGAHG
ncbi:MAG: methylmalonyl-CoA epimerase [Caulobacterales bacterium]|nr:methylmalonyl-CoA epimerase [Caulobacterales bacterium]